MLTKFRKRVLKYLAERNERKHRRLYVAGMRATFVKCPACGGDFSGHHLWRLASAILNCEGSRASELDRLIHAHEWEQATRIDEWEGTKDERMYYIVRCPHTPNLTMMVLISVFEMWDDDYFEYTEQLDDESTMTISRLANGNWEAFP